MPVRQNLEDMGHPQPPTLTQTGNYTTYGVVNNNIQPKATKSMDMRFHWLQDRERQNNSEHIGDLSQRIWEIIEQSTTQLSIIKTSAYKLSHSDNVWIHSNKR